MCLGVPGKVLGWIDQDPLFAKATIQFGGVEQDCHMACVPEAEVGDFVIVHAGVAIARIDEAEAMRIFHELQRLDDLETSKDRLKSRESSNEE